MNDEAILTCGKCGTNFITLPGMLDNDKKDGENGD